MTRARAATIGSFDIGLQTVATALAVWVACESVAEFAAAWTLAGIILMIGVGSALCGPALIRSDHRWWHGGVYAVALCIGAILAPVINGGLPGGGFPFEVMPLEVMSWMLVFGTAFAWTDTTLLFQGVPGIAVFGLVGVYDTYPNAPFVFFAYIACFAVVMYRIHRRQMLAKALASGFFDQAGSVRPTDVDEDMLISAEKGPWRGAAGPGIALLSALVVVALSVLGTPILRITALNLSDVMAIVPHANTPFSHSPSASPSGGPLIVGTGPHGPLSNRRLFLVRMNKPRYLRTKVLDAYQNGGWVSYLSTVSSPLHANPLPDPRLFDIASIEHPITFSFSITPLVPAQTIPVPGEITSFQQGNFALPQDDGGIELEQALVGVRLVGTCVEPRSVLVAKRAGTNLPDQAEFDAEAENIPADIVRFAQKAAGSKGSAFHRATLMMNAISTRCDYSLDAQPTPPGVDPVQYFLFHQRLGYCDLFASAMVLCARGIGIPARFVEGYLTDPSDVDSRGRYIVRSKDYHAWAELYFKNTGWVDFDATGGAKDVTGRSRPSGKGLVAVLVSIVAVAGTAGMWFAGKSLRKHWQNRKLSKAVQRQMLGVLYKRFEKLLSGGTGQTRLRGEPHEAFVERQADLLGPALDDARILAREFSIAAFASGGLTKDFIESLPLRLRGFASSVHNAKSARKDVKADEQNDSIAND